MHKLSTSSPAWEGALHRPVDKICGGRAVIRTDVTAPRRRACAGRAPGRPRVVHGSRPLGVSVRGALPDRRPYAPDGSGTGGRSDGAAPPRHPAATSGGTSRGRDGDDPTLGVLRAAASSSAARRVSPPRWSVVLPPVPTPPAPPRRAPVEAGFPAVDGASVEVVGRVLVLARGRPQGPGDGNSRPPWDAHVVHSVTCRIMRCSQGCAQNLWMTARSRGGPGGDAARLPRAATGGP
jgi:hypothetical protein